MVQGYHVYQDKWDAIIGEVLQCQGKIGNWHDPYAVAILSDGRVVGHMPQKIAFLLNIYLAWWLYYMFS